MHQANWYQRSAEKKKESLLSDKGARYYEMKKGKKARSQQSFEVLKAVQKKSARDMVDPVESP